MAWGLVASLIEKNEKLDLDEQPKKKKKTFKLKKRLSIFVALGLRNVSMFKLIIYIQENFYVYGITHGRRILG
jgi:hypothetical protein